MKVVLILPMQKWSAGWEYAEDWDGKDEMLNVGQYTHKMDSSFNKLCYLHIPFFMNYFEKSSMGLLISFGGLTLSILSIFLSPTLINWFYRELAWKQAISDLWIMFSHRSSRSILGKNDIIHDPFPPLVSLRIP